MEMKESHSKVKDIKYETFSIQPYITNKSFGTKEIEVLFNTRVRNLPVKRNFRGQYSDVWCRLCSAEPGGAADREEETQQHLLNCRVLIQNCPELYNDSEVDYSDFFHSDPLRQLRATRLMIKVLETRDKMMSDQDEQGL